MFQRFRNTVIQFMWGRNGTDPLNRFLFWAYFAIWVISLFFRNWLWGWLFALLLWAILGWLVFRTLSRNIPARQAENRWYLHQVTRLKDIRRYRYRRCPACKGMLRLPIKRGRRTVTCHRCRHQFKAFFL
ncbi:MAG: hypothetical protein IJB36_04280 [Clostridia bacterium]|nr:hypothetical protein [Clostridia bacterium]